MAADKQHAHELIDRIPHEEVFADFGLTPDNLRNK
jgi:hypothetical protein